MTYTARSASRDQSTRKRGSHEPLFLFSDAVGEDARAKKLVAAVGLLRDRRNNVEMVMTMRP
jgi:hypothetical protein